MPIMMQRFSQHATCVLAALACAGCNVLPVADKPYVSIINSLSWTNPMTGKPDGVRTAWPIKVLHKHVEPFPLAQVKKCDDASAACAWGVMNAGRTLTQLGTLPNGVTLELEVSVDIARQQEIRRPDYNGSMRIPSDVPALSSRRVVKQVIGLDYGKVHRIEFDNGVTFALCAARHDEARQALDACDIPFF